MITFNDTTERLIGRADVIMLATIDGNKVAAESGRPGFEPYFLVRVAFDSKGEHCIVEVPTGHHKTPTALVPHEIIITDGEFYWAAARHLTAEQLEANETPSDPALYILEEDDLPERLTLLTTADRDHIVNKIMKFCEEEFQTDDSKKKPNSPWIV